VNAVCRQFGGGGHRLASGAKVAETLDLFITQVEKAVLEQIRLNIV